MTTFDPTLAALDRPDQLGGALQQGLPRPMNPKLTWSVVKTFFLGGLTGGILPTLILPGRFRDFATAEQLQIWHLAEWLRLQTGDAESLPVTQAAQRIMPGSGLRWASIAFIIVAIGIACSALPRDGSLPPKWLALTLPELNLADFHIPARERLTNGLPANTFFLDERRHHGSQFNFFWRSSGSSATDQWHNIYHPDERSSPDLFHDDGDKPSNEAIAADRAPIVPIDLVSAFALAMSGAALCWLIEINAHIARVRKFVAAFNQLSSRYGIGPIRPPGVQLGLRPLWILGAAATSALGGFWAVPVMLAAAAHRRYINSTSLRLRSDLARRQRDVLLARRPPLRVPASTHLMGVCSRELCRAPNPPEAVYCRRCGTKLNLA